MDNESVFVVHLHMALLFGQSICSGLNSRVLCSCKQYFLRVITARNWLPSLEGHNFVHIDAVNATLDVILYAMHNFLSHSEVREILGRANISPTFCFSTDALEWSGALWQTVRMMSKGFSEPRGVIGNFFGLANTIHAMPAGLFCCLISSLTDGTCTLPVKSLQV